MEKGNPLMNTRTILFKKRRKYKYTLNHRVIYATRIDPVCVLSGAPISFSKDGVLTLSEGYSWDGASGPARDTKTIMRASLIHDALYQLIRMGMLDQSKETRKKADVILREICLEDGMSRFRAWAVYYAVRIFGAKAAKPDLKFAP